MTKIQDFRALQQRLNLVHNKAEGGFLSPTYQSLDTLSNEVLPDLNSVTPDRHLSGAIYYVITKNSPSRMHRTMGDILYHFYSGDPIEILLVYPNELKRGPEVVTFGNDLSSGHLPIKTIPGGTWIGSRVVGDGNYAVLGVTMAPGFHPDDYQVADPAEFKQDYPEYAEFVDTLFERQSFYIFDIDENMLSLPTKIILFEKLSNQSLLEISSEEFSREENNIGHSGPYKTFEIRFPDSFQYFNDLTPQDLHNGSIEYFIEDIDKAFEDGTYKGPSWDVFEYAVNNQRPTAIITARGHSSEVINAGMERLMELGAISQMPRIMDIQCVNNSVMKLALESKATKEEKSKGKINSSMRKRIATREFVEASVKTFGHIPTHKFGMSDDTKDNVYSVIQAMADSKDKFPHMRFYVINTHNGDFVKMEVEYLK